MRCSLDDRFGMSKAETASHPFVVATVVDPATKGCCQFPETLRKAAYAHVRELIDAVPVADGAGSEPGDDGANEPPAKWTKQDSRSASLRFLATTLTSARLTHEFERYIAAPEPEDSDALQWWSKHADSYPQTAQVARQYLSVPATSAQSERQFSAAGRLVSKLRSRLDPDRVDTIIFLYKNMA